MPDSDCSSLGFQKVDQSGELPQGSVITQQKCCHTDGCNGLQGTGSRIACMSCSEDEKYASQCQHAILCNPGQECMFYQYLDTSTYQKRIHLSCSNHEVCEILRSQPIIFGKRDELAMKKHCCNTDYCNIFWDQTSIVNSNTHKTQHTMKTTTPVRTTTTKKPVSTTHTTLSTTTTATTTTGDQFIPITNPPTTQTPTTQQVFVTLTNPVSRTPEQHTSTPGQQTTPVEQHTPTVEQHTPTVQQHTPTVQQHTPTPEQHTPSLPLIPITTSAHYIPISHTKTTQMTTETTTLPTTTTTTLPTTSTEPPANRCYGSSKNSNLQTVINCPDEAPYCLNNLTNYVDGKAEVAKGCATAGQCYWVPRESSSFYCDRYSSSHSYFAEFMCFYCCTGELCNHDTIASPASPFHPTVIPPNPITLPTVQSTNCYICDDCHGAGTLSTCTGSTPYCLNHYSNSQWGISHITKRCGSKQECHSQYYESTRYNLLCSIFNENIRENMRLECTFCCTTSNCNEHARPPQNTLYKE
ncbi:mucin-2-like [Saccostrea cucullata]|uniref:mucin-2-like n=1 Tax=Saccostrea cuccullata TaxID=36930 RepID=UPI002ED3E8D5